MDTSSAATRPVLITGASGNLGTKIVPRLAQLGWRLRLTDINPYAGELVEGSSFHQADLNDAAAISELARGCRAIVHLGGLVAYGSFEEVIGPNMRGTYHVFEAARQHGLRVVYASSNHVVGFYRREERLDKTAPSRPDSYYGLSKVVGEMIARFFWDRNGVESVSMRIGSCFPEPTQQRMLSTWLSLGDFAMLVHKSLEAPRTGCAVVWGVSNNRQAWWHGDDRELIGWHPADSADGWEHKLPADKPGLASIFQGGGFCGIDYTRDAPAQD